ncbi:PHP domain-containing protein [Butyrivibrio sp. WCD2001]|uniref:PHP domain-containing protein n=1 Tax=Butyrivibrio sp. WCD2001 TaxID=1280681 RepID=UPI00040EFE9B|nr:PHP domain-containing protein [Butyrivibrio sp. WCD2001]
MYVPIEKEVFHVHTKRCGHAGNYEDREYVETAIALGGTRIVFTDHAPFSGNPLGNRMPYEQLPEYIGAINQLREEYKGRIDIQCGLEVEYFPSYIEYYKELRDMKGLDVMLLGQHLFEHTDGSLSIYDQDRSNEFMGQLDAMVQGVESGLFDVVAHPDRSYRKRPEFGAIEREYADKLITAVKKSNYPIRLEYNYASRIEPGYFKEEFWEEVPKDLVIFGYDAHSPEEIVNGWNYYKDLTSHNHFVGRS